MVLHIFIFIILFLMLSVSVYNFFSAPYLEKLKGEISSKPQVSILIPARNEEGTIARCLDRVFSLDYQNIEVIVYNDESTDSTGKILEELENKHKNLKIIDGVNKPEGWTGKSWACHNLYKNSTGELLLFMDADVLIEKSCLDKLAPFIVDKDISLISCFPRQIIITLGEWLVVPLMNWILLSLLPLNLVYEASHPSLAAANGQFMLFKRSSYETISGHEAVKNKPVEDVSIANLLKKKEKKVLTVITKNQVYCRMYKGLSESLQGFTKNFFPGFNMPGAAFIVFITALFTAFFLPFILVFFDRSFILYIGLIFLLRGFVASSSAQNILINIILHPVQMIMMIFVGISSLHASTTGNIYWKGRRV